MICFCDHSDEEHDAVFDGDIINRVKCLLCDCTEFRPTALEDLDRMEGDRELKEKNGE
jgi:hypothetical protein